MTGTLNFSVSGEFITDFARQRFIETKSRKVGVDVLCKCLTTDEFGGSEDVLILDENGWRTVAMYCIPENKWYLSVGAIQGDCEYPFEITHWMPIPQIPKEDV